MLNPPSPRWLATTVLAGGIALLFVPPDAVRPLRNLIRDVLRPGQAAVVGFASHARGWIPPAANSETTLPGLAKDADELQSLRLANRRLEVEAARLREKLADLTEQQGLAPSLPVRPPLTTARLVEARVLGEETALMWRGKQLLNAGSTEGIRESALVLESTRPLIDLGSDARLSPGDAVYAGRIVIGKIAEVGRHTSTLRLVTDSGYSGRARLARRTARGLSLGAEGTLVAEGSELCRLLHITDPVNVGDEVFTGGADGTLPAPMYYGKVVRAELSPGAQDWSVWVKPAAAAARLETVLILRRIANPERMLAN